LDSLSIYKQNLKRAEIEREEPVFLLYIVFIDTPTDHTPTFHIPWTRVKYTSPL